MNCRTCGGTAFVTRRGDFKAHSGTVFKDIEFVGRCLEYMRYFRDLPELASKPIWNPAFCDAALKQHQAHFDRSKKKSDKPGRGF